MNKLLKLKTILFALLLTLSVAGCKSPSQDVKIVINMNIMKYSAVLRISDVVSGLAPNNVTVAVSGAGANDIYEIAGKKDFTVVGGVITFGLNPSVTPAVGADVNYTVTITAPGYPTTVQAMSFKNGVLQQIVPVAIRATGNTAPPATIVVTPPVQPTITLDFIGTCANRSDIQIRPSLYVFFRVKDSGTAFEYLGYIDAGKIQTKVLTQGKNYEFQINYGGTNYLVTQLITSTDYSNTFQMGSSICSTL